MTSLAKLRGKLLTDPDVKAEYDRLGPIFAAVGGMMVAPKEPAPLRGNVENDTSEVG